MNAPPFRLQAEPPLLSSDDPNTVSLAASILLRGGVVAIPTDTVYGLAASLRRPDAIRRLYDMKSRSPSKAIPILLGNVDALNQVAAQTSDVMARLTAHFWPGALTLVVEACDGLPGHVTTTDSEGRRTVAIRLPDYPLTQRIIAAAGGALAVTSANRSGETAAIDASQIRQLAIIDPDAIVDGGPVTGGTPSTIVSIVDSVFTILREGAIPANDILAFLQRSADDSEPLHGVAV